MEHLGVSVHKLQHSDTIDLSIICIEESIKVTQKHVGQKHTHKGLTRTYYTLPHALQGQEIT